MEPLFQRHDVLGVGNPFVDHILEVEEAFIQRCVGKKGGMVPVDYDTLVKIIQESGQEPLLVLGGSGANTTMGLARLGHRCGLIGALGTDDIGLKFLEQLHKMGVTSFLVNCETPTAQVACLITPDRERTMRSFLGASQEIAPHHLEPAIFFGARLVHLEGYSLMNGSLTESVMELAKAAGAEVSLDLGSFEVVEAHNKRIRGLLEAHVDILFGNQQEIHALTGAYPEKGCELLQKHCSIVVVLMGKEGALIGSGGEIIHVPALSVVPLDTTGAGDLFACGFLHGYLREEALERCGYYGSVVASEVIQVKGVSISEERWQELRVLFSAI